MDKAEIAAIKVGSVQGAKELCGILNRIGWSDTAHRVRGLLREVGQAEDHQQAVKATLALRNAMESILADLETRANEAVRED